MSQIHAHQSHPSSGWLAARRHSKQRAFTILKAAVASALITVVLSGLFVLQSNMMRMLASSTETTNASAHLQTRVDSDPWAPLVASGKGGYATAPMVIAANMEAFPTITPDPVDISGNTVHYGVSFHSTFQTLSTTSNGTDITLHNVTFIRSKNLAH